ncbi:hypothetical protein Syun_021646 [Stephania yunnanensis]|uniref:O-fucosyltransferase family protein n=1 Tax=Stephania yunnanensis TaxID=152371 RepID=A0AAP0NQV2_9MAGN
MFLKSRLKWVALVGLLLSLLSLSAHLLLAVYTGRRASAYQTSITVFSWRPIFGNARLFMTKSMYRRLWGPVQLLESLHPHANPRGYYEGPSERSNGFIFVRILGGFHEIRNSICDVVAVARLMNATLVIPELQSTTSSKGTSSDFKSFAYLYNEDQFIAALAKDVIVVKTLPKNLKWARRKKEIPSFRTVRTASPNYYRHHVLPVLKRHGVVELVISDGGCLQAILPQQLEEYQRLRCRVSFHALRFREDVQELATKVLYRLRTSGRPFVVFDPGMTRDALAYHGCAELFQDVHDELIQHRRLWMIKRGIIKQKLSVNSSELRYNGSCPLMPEEVGILLRAFGYPSDTIIYVSGGEVFGGQRTLIPLRAMFENVVDRTSLCTTRELSGIYGREIYLSSSSPPPVQQEIQIEAWKTSGPRPRPLPPPPARPKYPYNIEGWWGWVAESDDEPDSTVMELRTNAHKLLWEAIDYTVSIEADVFIPGFDRDGKGHPSFASYVMGHRLYQSAASKTFRPDRREVVMLLSEIRDHMHQGNHTWLSSIRKHLNRSLLDGLHEAHETSKPVSFLSHPAPECSCWKRDSFEASRHASSPSEESEVESSLGVHYSCPAWMNQYVSESSHDKETEEDLDEEDATSGLFPWQSNASQELSEDDTSSKDAQIEDQEDLENGEK